MKTERPSYQLLHRNYKMLQQLIPNLNEHLEKRTPYGKSSSKGFMDLSYDYHEKESDGNHIIILAHHFEMNGDLVPDPYMRIRVMPKRELIEALAYQDQFGYREVYVLQEGKKW